MLGPAYMKPRGTRLACHTSRIVPRAAKNAPHGWRVLVFCGSRDNACDVAANTTATIIISIATARNKIKLL